MGASQENHHQTRHVMSADAEVNQNPLKRIAVALEKGNPLKRIAVALERGNPLKRIAVALVGESLEANRCSFGEGESLEANRRLSLGLSLVANRSRKRSSEKRL